MTVYKYSEDVWRFIDLKVNDAYTNMAIDEAIGRLRGSGLSPNTIRFYRWKPSAVSVGYFQITEREVNIEACRELGVDIVRRMTGGGAVYHDYNGELTYSVIVNEDHPLIPREITKSYEVLCDGIVNALGHLGIEAEFKPINDIVVSGKKISGNAQTRRWGVVLQHGTILMSTDIRTMFKVLRVGLTKISDKAIKSVEERVTTIRRELDRSISFEEVSKALRRGFEEALGIRLVDGALTKEELNLAEERRQTKYLTEEWNFKRPKSRL